ncbi:DUF1269 domain-containing protein [Roseobacter ponti]|uniref:DUF1269 domain-containing protein n=1 Tax=Roseobacter ponti TaxID=1891787 RepID=A0A858STD1_9RHOB|nr:DUF1269 domain-containing protein [Roseobacter ponti]QJF51964.1 DUF1269 domain-containing protein [Roseobacter ponti]
MADLIAIGFDQPTKAFDMRARLAELQTEYLIDMEDVVVVTHEDNGKVKLHQASNLTAAGAVGGTFWGMLIGMLFLNPLPGAAVGAGTGALSGYMTDLGVSDDFMKSVGESLKPGHAAQFVLVRRVTGDKVIERLKDFAGAGHIIQTSLSRTSEEELGALLEETA